MNALLLVLVVLFAVGASAQVALISTPLQVFAKFNNGSATFQVPPALVGTQISSLTITAQPGNANGGQTLCCQSFSNGTSKCTKDNVWGCIGPKGADLFDVLLVGGLALDYKVPSNRLLPPPSFTASQLRLVTSYTCPSYQYPTAPYSATNPQVFANATTLTVVYSPPVTLLSNYTFVYSEFYNNGTGLGCNAGDNVGYTRITTVTAVPYVAPSTSASLQSSPSNIAASPSNIAASPSNVAASPSNVAASPSNVAASPSNVAASPSPAAASPSPAAASPSSASSPTSAASPSKVAASPSAASSPSVNNSPAGPQCIRCYNNCGGLLQRFRSVCTNQLFGTVTINNNAVSPLRHPHRPVGQVERRRSRTKGTRTICCNGVASSRISSPNFSWNSPFVCPSKREKLIDLCTLFGGNATCYTLPSAAASFGNSYYRCLPKA